MTVPFYPRFHLTQSELNLNNLQSLRSTVDVISSPSLLLHFKLSTNKPQILSLKGPEKDKTLMDADRTQVTVELKLKSALLWAEKPTDAQVTVTNTLTGQSTNLPVNIKLYGEAPKAAFLG